MINQNLPHQMRGDSHKVSPVLEWNSTLFLEPKKGLMDECRTLQRMVGALSSHIVMREPAKLFINQGQRGAQRIVISRMPLPQE
jgi:hypothetical protein